ncbi:hypothetical protein PROFUN_05085 [Planoprotostelium fungivorum]|uniref:Uncharacterized protein n=1 Tax=Planoprotostelium fungivorum TaxID=1890364 RepID=A0A2P6NRM5_9EUKA|nr:hypothetical protein PROFUN_05085 [Planoprotostelium fungivorum]
MMKWWEAGFSIWIRSNVMTTSSHTSGISLLVYRSLLLGMLLWDFSSQDHVISPPITNSSALDSPGYARFGISAISYACSLFLGPSSGRWTMIERWEIFNHQQHWTLSYQRPRLRILRFFLRQNTTPKRLEIDAWAILFAWMLSFGPLGSQDHITSYDLMSITNKTPPDQLETTRIAFYATFYARRCPLEFFPTLHMEHGEITSSHHQVGPLQINSRTLDSNSTLNSTPEDPFLSHKRTKLIHTHASLYVQLLPSHSFWTEIWLFALPGLSFWSISPGHLTGLSARPLRAALGRFSSTFLGLMANFHGPDAIDCPIFEAETKKLCDMHLHLDE